MITRFASFKSADVKKMLWLGTEKNSAPTQKTMGSKQHRVTTRLPPKFTNEKNESDIGYWLQSGEQIKINKNNSQVRRAKAIS